jgi:cellulose synthase operon protein C
MREILNPNRNPNLKALGLASLQIMNLGVRPRKRGTPTRPRSQRNATGWSSGLSWSQCQFRVLLLAALLVLGLPIAKGEPDAAQIDTRDAVSAIDLDWRAVAATTALRMGLSSRAVDLYSQLLAESPDSFPPNLTINLAIAHLQSGANNRALETLEFLAAEPLNPRRELYWLIAHYRLNRNTISDDLKERLEAIEIDALDAFDVPWYHLLRSLVLEDLGQMDELANALNRARESATESGQTKLFEALLLREEMRIAPLDETQIVNLQTRLQAATGEAAAFPFARQIAIALHVAGRSAEAIATIDQQLALASDFGVREREQLLLLKGMILGSDTADGRAAFRELIRGGSHREAMAIALQLLAMQAQPGTPESTNLASFLDELVTRSEPHPLLGEVYLIRAQLSLDRNDIALAEEDAQRLLERFPGLDSIHRAYHVLGLAALRRDPPQYRTAANFFQQYRDAIDDSLQRQQLAIIIGDCYFLNRDFENAAEFYRAAWQTAASDDPLPPIFLRLISAHLRANAVEQAIEWVDNPDVRERIPPLALWRAEWNLSRYLSANNRKSEALQRIEERLETMPESPSELISLRLRLLWLKVRLHQSMEQETDALRALQQLTAGIDALESSSEKDLLQAESLLLQAEILLRANDFEQGNDALQALRENFPATPPADRSFFVEAAQLARRGELANAQERLFAFSRTYQQSPLAAQALFDSAILAEKMGPDLFRESLQRLDRLAEEYPNSPLVFQSRLRQGHLLRRLGDFPSAQSIYETLLSRFPEHPMRYAAELGRADSLLALSRNDPNALGEIQQIYERILDLPRLSPSTRAEILYKQAHTLTQRELADAAIDVLMRLVGTFLSSDNDSEAFGVLDENGRYWLARGLLDLGTLLETKGRLREARRSFLTIERLGLPGRQLARTRADALRITDPEG